MITIPKEELADEGRGAGVEEEVDAPSPNEPFDPASISLSSKVVALDAVLRRLRNGTITLAPDFQRNYVWDQQRKSLLIESMMLRIPLPMFYVSEDRDGVWEVVDGLQRLTTIRDFILGEDGDGKGFLLKGLEFWGEQFDGKDFYSIERRMLSTSRVVNNIMEAELSFTIINPDTPDSVKRNIFKRLNTGGMRLSSQEIRHALYQGKASELLKDIIDLGLYRRYLGKTVKDDRMAGRELVLRFISFHLRGHRAFKASMDDFLSDTMRFLNGDIQLETIASTEHIIRHFQVSLSRAVNLFGNYAFRRASAGERKTPINKSLFDVWMYYLVRLSKEWMENINRHENEFLKNYYELFNDAAFNDSIGRYGGEARGVTYRYQKIGELLSRYHAE